MLSSKLSKLRMDWPWPSVKPEVSEDATRIPSWSIPQHLLKSNLSTKTQLIVEIGSWLGSSARFMLDNAPNATIICIDPWDVSILESMEEFKSADYEIYKMMFPTIYEAFLSECWEYRDRIVPLRATSSIGLKIIHEFGLRPNIIYIDGSHKYEDVKIDLGLSYRLFPEAVLIGDDYKDNIGVRHAVNHFMYDNSFALQVAGSGWQILKNKIPVLHKALEEARLQ